MSRDCSNTSLTTFILTPASPLWSVFAPTSVDYNYMYIFQVITCTYSTYMS